MKSTTHLLLTLAVVAFTANASVTVGSSTWTWQNPMPLGNGLNAINCPGATNCFAVGDLGTILVTTNGTTWTSQASPSTRTLRGVSCPNPTTCYAVGDGGLILKTDDGTTWFQQPSGTGANLRGISCFSNAGCMIAAAGGTVLITVNAGATWYTSIPATKYGQANNVSSVSCLNNGTITCVVAGTYVDFFEGTTQLVWSTTDLGGTWTALYGSSNTPFRSFGNITALSFGLRLIDSRVPGGVYTTSVVVTDQGYALYLLNTGIETIWYPIGQVTTSSLYAVTCLPSECFAVGNSKEAYTFLQELANVTWFSSLSFAPTSPPLYGISCPSACFAVGGNGVIVSSPSQIWESQWTTVTSNPLISASCPAGGVCYAVGWNGTIVSTTNGSTWTKAAASNVGTTANLQAVNCPSKTQCIAVGAGGAIVGTNNSGQTWPAQKSNTFANLNAVTCPDIFICYAGGAGVILATGNSGLSWFTETPPPSGTTITGIYCTGPYACIAVGTGPVILTTTNSFAGWTRQSVPTPNALTAVTCLSSSTCIAVGNAGTILRTTNDAASWSPVASPTTQDLTSISCLGATCYAGTFEGSIISSFNSGSSWGVEAELDPNLATQFLGGIPPKILSASGIEGLSCAESFLAYQCIAVGSEGTIVSKYVPVQIVTLGTGDLTPSDGSSAVGEPITFSLNWTVPAPEVWRDLKYLDIRLADDAGIGLWARFIPGNPSALALLDSNGNIVSEGVPGGAGNLDSPTATLDLAHSSFEASGPTSPTVTVNFAVALKPSAAPGPGARVYHTQILITNVSGESSAPDDVGHWAVRPNH
jgi:photosystem II stability/assembly factor-like uncharacterized protein